MPRRPADRGQANEIAKRLGDRVRGARSTLDLTQDELSERIGITAEALGRIERGAATPSFPTFMRLCAAVERTPDALLLPGQQERHLDGRVDAAPRRSREVRRVTEVLSRLTPRQHRLLLEITREMIRSRTPLKRL